jgi:hypothetical protein
MLYGLFEREKGSGIELTFLKFYCIILPAVCKMSGKTNQSLSRRCVHLYEVRYSPALSLGRLYLRINNIKKKETYHTG